MTAKIIPFLHPRTYDDAVRDNHAPLVNYATPEDIRRKLADERPDLFEAFRREPSLAQGWRDLCAELRASPESHALAAIAGALGFLLLLCLPFVLGVL